MLSANKKLILIVTIAAFATLLAGMAIAELNSTPEAAEDLDNDKVTNQSYASLYEWAYAKATSEQKVELTKSLQTTALVCQANGDAQCLLPLETCQKTSPG